MTPILNLKWAKWYLKYHFVLAACFVPAYAVNLGVVWLFAAIHFQLIWVLSSVIIGDVVAYEINLVLGLWLQNHWPLLQRIQKERFEI